MLNTPNHTGQCFAPCWGSPVLLSIHPSGAPGLESVAEDATMRSSWDCTGCGDLRIRLGEHSPRRARAPGPELCLNLLSPLSCPAPPLGVKLKKHFMFSLIDFSYVCPLQAQLVGDTVPLGQAGFSGILSRGVKKINGSQPSQVRAGQFFGFI